MAALESEPSRQQHYSEVHGAATLVFSVKTMSLVSLVGLYECFRCSLPPFRLFADSLDTFLLSLLSVSIHV